MPFEQVEHIRSVDDSVQPQITWKVEVVWRKLPVEEARKNLPRQITPDDGAMSPSQPSDLRRAALSTSRSAAAMSNNGGVASTSYKRSAEREQRPRSLQPSYARMAEFADVIKKARFTALPRKVQERPALDDAACVARFRLPIKECWTLQTPPDDPCVVALDQAQSLEEQTRGQSRSKLWHSERGKRITASQFGDTVKRKAAVNEKYL